MYNIEQNRYRFFHIKMDGGSLGIFAGESPADAAIEWSADADLGAVHRALAKALQGNSFPIKGLVNGCLADPDAAATSFVALPNVEIEDMSTWSIEQLDLLARKKNYGDWLNFLHVQSVKSGFWASKSLSKTLIRQMDALS